MHYRELDQFVMALDSKVSATDAELPDGPMFGAILAAIIFHARARYWQFTPTYGRPFLQTLADWLSNEGLTEDDKKTMLASVLHFQFVDRDDMLALYRAAFRGPIVRWLFDELDLDFGANRTTALEAIRAALKETWFCGVTDSMDIAQFHHVNNLTIGEHRPPWRVLAKFGDGEKIRNYMQSSELRRIVLLEDFVGSGTQSKVPIAHAVRTFCPETPILFVPLIASHIAVKRLRDGFGTVRGFTFDPAFTLPLTVQLQETTTDGEPAIFGALRQTVANTFPRVREPNSLESKPLRHAFGFGKVGALLVMYTNCPNNTLPLVWHEAPRWRSLFQRVSRS